MWAAVSRLSSSTRPLSGGPGPLAGWVRQMATMKRRFKGLYGGKHIMFGNTVSFSHQK